jgi:hypothetical protein
VSNAGSELRKIARRSNAAAVRITLPHRVPLLRCECGQHGCQRQLRLTVLEHHAARADARWLIVAAEHAEQVVTVTLGAGGRYAVIRDGR